MCCPQDFYLMMELMNVPSDVLVTSSIAKCCHALDFVLTALPISSWLYKDKTQAQLFLDR